MGVHTVTYRGTHGYIGVRTVTWGCTGLDKATQGYMRLHKAIQD